MDKKNLQEHNNINIYITQILQQLQIVPLLYSRQARVFRESEETRNWSYWTVISLLYFSVRVIIFPWFHLPHGRLDLGQTVISVQSPTVDSHVTWPTQFLLLLSCSASLSIQKSFQWGWRAISHFKIHNAFPLQGTIQPLLKTLSNFSSSFSGLSAIGLFEW